MNIKKSWAFIFSALFFLSALYFIIQSDIKTAVFAHILCSLFSIIYIHLNHKYGSGSFTAIILFFPLGGWLIFSTYILSSKFNIRENAAEEFDEHISYTIKNQFYIPAEDEQKKIMREKLNIEPFNDMISSSGRIREKLKAISYLTGIKDRASVGIIKKAVKDISFEVKYAAVSAIKKIETPMIEDLKNIESELEQKPDDPRLHKQAADLYYDYSYLRIPTGASLRNALNKALDHYKKAVEFGSSRDEVQLLIGKIFLELDNPEEALNYFREYRLKVPEDFNGYLFEAEALFRMRRYRQLTDFFKQTDESKIIKDTSRKTIIRWEIFSRQKEAWV
ncbi:MAG: hypothetical protein ACLFQK_01395 [Fibrobacterota bacterium]